MRYYRVAADDGTQHLVARDGETAFDLTSSDSVLNTYAALGRAAEADSTPIDAFARDHQADAEEVSLDALEDASLPVLAEEVWACGVTYEISEQARESESSMPEVYLGVYEADRPELFFKATPSRTVGPAEPVGIRGDSNWNTPEPELGVVLRNGEIVGFTIGNDMSSREIEGENPLYLPQAKVYDRCCSIGPCVASTESIEDPHDLEMTIEIERDGELVYEDATSTGEMARTCEELVSYLTRHNPLPEMAVLLTGTSLVPPDEFSLAVDDDVRIDIEGIGTLSNPVIEV